MLVSYSLYVTRNDRGGRGRWSKSIAIEQGTIHYRDEGEGEPLVFVHGLLVDGRLWRGVTPLLTHSHRCIVAGLAARLAPHGADGRAPTARRAASRT